MKQKANKLGVDLLLVDTGVRNFQLFSNFVELANLTEHH